MNGKEPSVNRHILDTITWLQFPMAALIVCAHSVIGGLPDNPVMAALTRSIMQLFVLISGYLFFFKLDSFGATDFFRAMRHKVSTNLLPYLLWYLVATFVFCLLDGFGNITEFLTPEAIFGVPRDGGESVSLTGLRVEIATGPLANGGLWFFRDLLLIFPLTPLIWMFAQLSPRVTVPLTLLLIFLNFTLPGFRFSCPLWFTLGAIFAIRRIDFVRICRRLTPVLVPAWLILVTLYAWMHANFDTHHLLFGRMSIMAFTLLSICGVFAPFAIASVAVGKGPRHYQSGLLPTPRDSRFNRFLRILAPTSFFVYVMHDIECFPRIMSQIADSIADPQLSYTVTLLTMFLTRIILLPLLYFTMVRHTPRLLSILTGGRARRSFQSPEKLLTLQSEQLTESTNC